MKSILIGGNIWLDISGLKVGKGRVDLLESIKKYGSISGAAKNLNIPYRKAWDMVKEMNKSSECELVIKTIGGMHGGGAILTGEGEKVLKAFYRTMKKFENFRENTVNILNK